jgi:hypothetical protein
LFIIDQLLVLALERFLLLVVQLVPAEMVASLVLMALLLLIKFKRRKNGK